MAKEVLSLNGQKVPFTTNKIKTNAYRINHSEGDSFILGENDKLILKLTGVEGTFWDEDKNCYKARYIKNICIKNKLFPGLSEEESHTEAEKFLKKVREEEGYQKAGDIIEITVKDYMNLKSSVKNILYLFKQGVEFKDKKNKPVLDPYLLGIWLGAGENKSDKITTKEIPIVKYLKEFGEKNKLEIKVLSKNKYAIRGNNNNIFIETLTNYNLVNNRHIPEEYLYGDYYTKMELFAGIIDSYSTYNKRNNTYEIRKKTEQMTKDISFLAQSLGFKVTKKESNGDRIYISGENICHIPVLLPGKIAEPNKKDSDFLLSSFIVTPIGVKKIEILETEEVDKYLDNYFIVRSCIKKEQSIKQIKKKELREVIDI